MKFVTRLFQKHPVAMIFYLLYCLQSGCIADMSLEGFKERHVLDGGLPYVFTVFIAGVFIIINLISLAVNKQEWRFYLWLSLIILVQTCIAVSID